MKLNIELELLLAVVSIGGPSSYPLIFMRCCKFAFTKPSFLCVICLSAFIFVSLPNNFNSVATEARIAKLAAHNGQRELIHSSPFRMIHKLLKGLNTIRADKELLTPSKVCTSNRID